MNEEGRKIIILHLLKIGETMSECLDCKSEIMGKRKFCESCRKEKARRKSATYHKANRTRVLARFAEKYAGAKVEVFNHYGNKCWCCGESDQRFLTIDHIANDGYLWRTNGNGQHKNIYQWLQRNGCPDGYQVACMNCNVGKHRNKGICPHQEGSTISRKA